MASAIGHYGLLITLVHVFAIEPVVASVGGAFLGAIINYTLNYRFTFRSKTRHIESFTKFALVAFGGMLLNTLFMWIGIYFFILNYLLTQVITTLLIFSWSFIGNRYWTFKRDLNN